MLEKYFVIFWDEFKRVWHSKYTAAYF